MSGKQIAVNPLYWIGGDYFTLTYNALSYRHFFENLHCFLNVAI